jgi:hypothetical protein
MESSSSSPHEMPRRAFLLVGTAVMAAGCVSLLPTRAEATPTLPAAPVTEAPPTRSHATLLGLL